MPTYPWEDGVDIRDMTAADFEKRNATISIYDVEGRIPPIMDVLVDEYDCNESVLHDRCLRIYLAYVADNSEFDYRERYNTCILIPPVGWVEEHADEFPVLEYDPPTGESYRSNPSTAPTVKQIADKAIERSNEFADKLARLAGDAVQFVADGCRER